MLEDCTGPLGLYGGSFDPIHRGHLAVARAATGAFGLSKVVFMPAARPPHKPGKRLAGPRDRLAMVELALADEAQFVASTLELEREGPSYSMDTVLELLSLLPEPDPGLDPTRRLHLIMGSDNLPGLPGWHRAEELLGQVQPVVYGRGADGPGLLNSLAPRLSAGALQRLKDGYLDLPKTPGRATYLRSALARGVRFHANLDPAVTDYALRRGLYGPPRPAPCGI